jgi:hypothetical protein
VDVHVTDGTNTDFQLIGILIADVNDNAPEITSNGGASTAAISVPEGTTAELTRIKAIDPDDHEDRAPGENPPFLTYTKSGADAGRFTLTGDWGAVLRPRVGL